MEMKDELQGKLVEILTSIQTAAGKASDFAMEQLPDIAQSYVAFGRAYESAMMLVAVALIAFGVWCCVRTTRADNWGDLGPLPTLPVMAGGIWALLSAKGLLLVWFAPKVWLLKEIATILK